MVVLRTARVRHVGPMDVVEPAVHANQTRTVTAVPASTSIAFQNAKVNPVVRMGVQERVEHVLKTKYAILKTIV